MIVKHIGLLLLAFIIQSTVVEHISIRGIKPDIILIILIYVSLRSGSMMGVVLGFSIGLLQDFYGPPANLGLNALCKSLLGFGVGIGKEGLYKDSMLVLMLTLVISYITHDIIYHIIDARFTLDAVVSWFIGVSLPSVFYTLVLSLLLIYVFAYRRGQLHAKRLFPE
ncbi:MAG TPA: rod shape-determining protein MreD [candidate division Zixibacteria bacterium]|jgi:rod shape-determining protein MreD|nr:rod shape-determining protein MreD [Candidatus Latescibacterota bacterium]MDP7238386.1 rod shape-determining protein MreD [Candidatus Latescibacterota bacterium]HIG48910.1 rod shape-determining protein MreD [candidate division Zixibacteria bacterium]